MSAKTVLIVEDDQAALLTLRGLLGELGVRTLAAASADEALSLATADRPDLILMDIQLNGHGGLQATQLLKRERSLSTVPIIALAALAPEDERDQAIAAGCDSYVAKPIDAPAFRATVSRVLGL